MVFVELDQDFDSSPSLREASKMFGMFQVELLHLKRQVHFSFVMFKTSSAYLYYQYLILK